MLDNKTFELIKYCSESIESGLTCPEHEQNTPDDFELKIAFEYDNVNDVINAETVGLSSCGNSFSISMKGGDVNQSGSVDNTLQLWTSEPGTSALSDGTQPCHYIENMLYAVLDIGCYEHNYGNIRVNIDADEAGVFILERENLVFATDFLTFQETTLSVEDQTFQNIKPFQIEGNPYLQIVNPNNQLLTVEIYNTSGQQVFRPKIFEENSIDISTLSFGLYFIKLSTRNKQQKVFKFILN